MGQIEVDDWLTNITESGTGTFEVAAGNDGPLLDGIKSLPNKLTLAVTSGPRKDL